jgi:hypothetical protein
MNYRELSNGRKVEARLRYNGFKSGNKRQESNRVKKHTPKADTGHRSNARSLTKHVINKSLRQS